jgi:hypothetical protein
MYPNLDSLSNAYLQWMFDNQPEYVLEFLNKNRIAELDHLLNNAAPGWKFYHQRKAEGMSHAEALDLALEALIPKDGPEFSENPPKPIPPNLRLEISDRLEALEEGFARSQRSVRVKKFRA